MKQSEAIKIFLYWDKRGRYVFRKSDIGIALGENGGTLDQTIARLVKAGILERAAHGVYVFTASAHIGGTTIEHVARNLRRGEHTFESLESALSKWGVISQIPLDRVTLMTTGRSGEYITPYGVIEFTHTKASAEDIIKNTVNQGKQHALPLATKHYAYQNLKSVRRNLDLVDEEELNAQD